MCLYQEKIIFSKETKKKLNIKVCFNTNSTVKSSIKLSSLFFKKTTTFVCIFFPKLKQ